ncbi:LysR family transcriptional regulator [Martelella radicis]|uniref:DNA-binding transcriptional LysR family regulator n=1 Tax=Martelella radicis TaxID=1397476 RepID=A0A7W6KHK6_9HYPH|nr:LysR family transcriptional regulator [Martelella radicis]MBB4120334.1 DNA-binding transcriptional LysR family regulator [Martelella radicis]
MADPNWDDLQLFHVVAELGGLSAAAQRTGLSAPTIGRRMLALERTLGRSLFLRSQRGYRLAHDGEVLFERVSGMQAVADAIADWHGEAFAMPWVSIAVDSWLAGFAADSVLRIKGPEDGFRICLAAAGPSLALAFREADVAVLGARPDSGNLAVRRAGTMAYAVYRRHDLAGDDAPWVSMGTGSAVSASDRWVFENRESAITTWTEDRDLLVRLVAAGAGQGVLPVYLGDANPVLERVDGIIDELTHSLFIVANDDDRHRPEVRTVIERLAAFIRENDALLAGRTGG